MRQHIIATLGALTWLASLPSQTYPGPDGSTWVVERSLTPPTKLHNVVVPWYRVSLHADGGDLASATFTDGPDWGAPLAFKTFAIQAEGDGGLVVLERDDLCVDERGQPVPAETYPATGSCQSTPAQSRWDGQAFVRTAGVAQSEQVLVERSGTEWRVRREDAPSPSPQVEMKTWVVMRREPGGTLGEVTRVQDSSFIQTNPTMLGSTSWQFLLKGGAFRAELRREVIEGHAKQEDSTQLLRWNGQSFVLAK
jgi:hypothetical protein